MALDKNRLKGKIVTIMTDLSTRTTDPTLAMNDFADQVAQAVVDEIKELVITYTTGLITTGGPVTGTFNFTLS